MRQEQPDRAATTSADWLPPNGSCAQTRYYPGAQINKTNVSKPRAVFVFQSAVNESVSPLTGMFTIAPPDG
ncbi:hypothetical protein [Paraburkholderia xenovorans]|uniref:hypothetical protein n=1 Tax=Paraburkholderia xenovorans TaxID=36873 RepID=UPI000037E1BF|nr:hypothetical protein [Paraburkholderia xenovorans]